MFAKKGEQRRGPRNHNLSHAAMKRRPSVEVQLLFLREGVSIRSFKIGALDVDDEKGGFVWKKGRDLPAPVRRHSRWSEMPVSKTCLPFCQDYVVSATFNFGKSNKEIENGLHLHVDPP